MQRLPRTQRDYQRSKRRFGVTHKGEGPPGLPAGHHGGAKRRHGTVFRRFFVTVLDRVIVGAIGLFVGHVLGPCG